MSAQRAAHVIIGAVRRVSPVIPKGRVLSTSHSCAPSGGVVIVAALLGTPKLNFLRWIKLPETGTPMRLPRQQTLNQRRQPCMKLSLKP